MSRLFFKNAGILAATEMLLRLRGLVFIPLLTRHFGAVDYGAWTQLTTLTAAFAPLVMLATDSGAVRHLSGRSRESMGRGYSAWILLLLTNNLFLGGLLLLFREPLTRLFFGQTGEYVELLPLAVASLAASIGVNAGRTWFQLQSRAAPHAIMSILQAVLALLALLAMLSRGEGVYELALYMVGGDLLLIAGVVAHLTRRGCWGKPELAVLRPILAYGLPLIPVGYAMWGLNYMDRLFLIQYGALAQIGVYGLMTQIGYLVIQILINPLWSFYPNTVGEMFNQGRAAEIQPLFEQVAGLVLFLALPAAVGLFLLREPVVGLLATEAFLPGTPLLLLLTLGYLFHMLGSFYAVSLGLIGKQYWTTVAALSACGVNFGLNWLWIPDFGLAGAAWATALSFLVQMGISMGAATRFGLLHTPWRFPLKILLACLAMGLGIALWLSVNATGPVGTLIFGALLGTLLYLGATSALGVVPWRRLRQGGLRRLLPPHAGKSSNAQGE